MIKISFRNIHRNGKRSILTAISVAMGVAGIIIAFTYFLAMEDMLIEEGTKVTGDLRITAKDYDLKSKTLDISSNINLEEIEDKIKDVKGIREKRARIRFGAYVFKGENEKKALGTAVEDIEEISPYIYIGKNLDSENGGRIVIGSKLREKLAYEIGDEVTVMVSTQNASLFAMTYKISGFYSINPKLDNGFYIILSDAWYLLDMDGYITEYLLYFDDIKNSANKKLEILDLIGDDYLTKIWSEIGINSSIYIWVFFKIILIVVVGLLSGLAITNTMMMAVFERRRELGVLKAMGMSELRIFSMFSIEAFFIGVMGSVLGVLLGGGFAWYFSERGIVLGEFMDKLSSDFTLSHIIYTKLDLSNLCIGFVSGMIFTIIAGTLPLISISKQEAVDNLRD